jgi:hypothetical protein
LVLNWFVLDEPFCFCYCVVEEEAVVIGTGFEGLDELEVVLLEVGVDFLVEEVPLLVDSPFFVFVKNLFHLSDLDDVEIGVFY